MNAPPDLISVVIPTYYRKSQLRTVIAPLLDDPGTGEIVVVVDGALDGSFELLTELARIESRVRPIFQENGGESAARRRGVKEARLDTVLLLDDDVVADEGLVTAHAFQHVGNSNRLVLGYMPTLIPARRLRGQVPTILYAEAYETACALFERDRETIFTSFWAGNASIGRANYLRVTTDDESRFPYHEDLRFGLQCQSANLEALFDRRLRATHMHSRSLRMFARDSRRSGEGWAQITKLYPRLASDVNPLFSASTRNDRISRYLGSRFVRPLSAPSAMAASNLAGRLKLWEMEKGFAQVLQLVETAFGYQRMVKALSNSIE